MPANDSDPRTAYQFGDSDLAAERLRLLAAVFEQSSRGFLVSLAEQNPQTIADLGCGPGFTTRLLAEVFPLARVVGFDCSQRFVDLARQRADGRVSYHLSDVTQSLAGGPFDLIYCRYVLTHVPEPHAAVERWGRQLPAGGAIAIEENEWIETDEPALRTYVNIAEALLADAGQALFVGARLARAASWPGLTERASIVTPVAVRDRDAAGMFLLNLQTWRARPFVEKNHPAKQLDRLRDDLTRLAAEGHDQRAITFGLRQLVLQKT